MAQKWERIFTCDRCGAEKRVVHHCGGPSDWAKDWGDVDGLDLCPRCVKSFHKWSKATEKS